MAPMKHLVDKLVIAVACGALLGTTAPQPWGVIGLLGTVMAAALFELVPWPWRGLCAALPCAALVLAPGLPVGILPLPAYDLTRTALAARRWGCAIVAALPLVAVFGRTMAGATLSSQAFPAAVAATAPAAILATLAALLALRTTHSLAEQHELKRLRDTLQESVLHLCRKNAELDEARAYQERAATLAERARIARAIHDNVGHLLTRSIFQVEALQVVHASDALGPELAPLGATLHEALDTVRASVHNLHDESVDLEVQLASLARTYPGGTAELAYTADGRATPAITDCLTSITREALANAARHGHASHVRIAVEEHPTFWRLRVTNNGPVAEPLPPAGLGLRSMRERVDAHGGTFWAAPTPDGFTVFATVPK